MILKCPKCKKLLEVPEEKLGKKDVCEHCDNVFIVDDLVIYKEPQPKTPTPPPPPIEEKKVDKVNETMQPSFPKRKTSTFTRIILGILIVIIGVPTTIFVLRSCRQGM